MTTQRAISSTRRARHRHVFLRLCLVAALVVPIAVPSVARAETALQAVTLRMDWVAIGYHAPFFLASARGYYKAEGLDVHILNGRGSGDAILTVGSGTDTLGLANLSTMALAVAKSQVPVIAVACLIQKEPTVIVALQSSGIKTVKDLVGKRYGQLPGAAGARLFPAFAAHSGIDPDKVIRVNLSYATEYSGLLQGNVDFITGWAFTDALELAKQKPLNLIKYADHGVNTLSIGVIVSKDTLAQRPDMVRGFLAATLKGYAAAAADPEAAVDALVQARPGADRGLMLKQLKGSEEYLHTENSVGHPVGWMARKDWDQTRDLLIKYFGMSPDIRVDALYTNALLPAR